MDTSAELVGSVAVSIPEVIPHKVGRIKIREPAPLMTNTAFYKKIEQDVAKMDTDPLRQYYGPEMTDSDIRTIETMMRYKFRNFQQSELWAGSITQPSLPVKPNAPLETRLEKLKNFEKGEENAAFAGLDFVETNLQGDMNGIHIDQSLKMIVREKLKQQGGCVVWDIGCGGQAADINLLAEFEGENGLRVHGIGARDYGANVRKQFPEFEDQLTYSDRNIYTDSFGEESADVVFSNRTFSYTGVMDIKRFTHQMYKLAKKGGIVWCSGIHYNLIDFSKSLFKIFPIRYPSRI